VELSEAGSAPRRIVVAISGASGAAYGVRLLQALREAPGFESHLVVSAAGWRTLRHEMDLGPQELGRLAHCCHDVGDVGAVIASGSARVLGMVVAPCSMRTLAAIAQGLGDNLITRAADVMLKERRRLVLLAREAPLHLGHLRNMVAATEMGAIVCPPVPAFYLHPRGVQDIVDQAVGRALDLLDVPHGLSARWAGEGASA
jgi:4-hydroxy-3-polyprenylbenzoate decarboxylase